MSASFYDLLKYAATGIASPDMTHYDKMRALAMAGGSKVQTLTGVPPISFQSDGTPLISWSVLGNGQQTGTPSPQSIIMPTFCGVRTAQLWDENYPNISGTIRYIPLYVGDGTFTLSTDIDGALNENCCLFLLAGNVDSGANYGTNGVISSTSRTVTSSGGYVTIGYRLWGTGNPSTAHTMLNLGSTALPYEPYGWKIPITCAGQTVPVYLGQTQTVRRVKKLVLNGTENWFINEAVSTENTAYLYATFLASNTYVAGYSICSHFEYKNAYTILDENGFQLLAGYGGLRFRIMRTIAGTVADFKAWLASEYAEGHPVVIWYVLAEAQTAIVNEPLAKIGDYCDELSSTDASVTIPTIKGDNVLTVDTPIQPSEMSITYKG